jgi:hypothetical protein
VTSPIVNFDLHKIRAGNIAGARDDFEDMVTDLVAVTNPGVFGVHANPGDWGIDALVGALDGDVAVWQAKYFIDGYGETQRKQVQESYRRVREEATKRKFRLCFWTVCVPVELPAPELALWQKWARKKEADDGLVIELWPKGALRRRLISPDAYNVLTHYYQGGGLGRAPRDPLGLQDLPEGSAYERALFVRQLRHNGHTQLGASQRQFFNAELMVRDVADKAVQREVDALRDAEALVEDIWSERFDEESTTSQSNQLPALLGRVMDGLRSQHKLLPPHLPARLTHFQGLAHKRVEAGAAGWSRDWETVRDAHAAEEAAESQGNSQPESAT